MPALLRRFLLAPLPRLLWTLLLAGLLGRVLTWIAPALARASNVSLTGSFRNAVLTLFIFTLCLWLFEGKRPRDAGLGLRGAVSQTTRGFFVGALLLTVVTGVLALAGCYQLVGWASLPEGTTREALFGRVVLLFLAVAIFEEVAVRGILFRQLEQAIGTWLAIVVSALFFGFGHRGNPAATWISSVAIAIEAGGLLAAAYVATRSLWLPIGMHWAWNLFEGPVWGSRVSGNDVAVLADARFPGPALLTGGAFGPEAGLPAMVLGVALGAWFIALAIRHQQIVTPSWMRWVAGRLRRRWPEPVEPAPAPATVTPSSEA
ncbi:MAG TPA: CPBP family intramembrane glutamic endopeptidase [Myxococcaceae bacterium]|nr:CPBP family intramembrane glutamic endopeptidase [Myxococcaceae bacterium]